VHAAGGLIIADEVQAGYWPHRPVVGLCNMVGLAPDIIVTGKPMGAGLPLAATTAKRDLVERFRAETRYFNTFAASPLQGAVGLAVIEVLESEGMIENARDLGAELKAALGNGLATGRALSMCAASACSLPPNLSMQRASPIRRRLSIWSRRLRHEGFLTSIDGAFNNTVKMRPPLALQREDALAFLDAFDKVVAERAVAERHA